MSLVIFLIFTVGIAIYFSMPVSNPLNDPFIQLLLHHPTFTRPSSPSPSPNNTSSLLFDSAEMPPEPLAIPRPRSRYAPSHASLDIHTPPPPQFPFSSSVESSDLRAASESPQDLSSSSLFPATSNFHMTRERRRICIIIAHPDDEVMFFAPAILQLCDWAQLSMPTPPYSFLLSGKAIPLLEIYLLCFSSGNAEGLGRQRVKELFASATTLGLSIDHISLIQGDPFPDGMNQQWPIKDLSDHIHSYVDKWKIDVLVTFDAHGVSLHPNHISLYEAVKFYQSRDDRIPILGLSLHTSSIIMKYTGFLSLLLYPSITLWSTLYNYFSKGDDGGLLTKPSFTFVIHPLDYIMRIWPAMLKHRSQLVWFRYLYMIFSMYLFQNTFHLIE